MVGILGEISRTEGGSTGNIRRFIDMIADNTCPGRKGNTDGKGRFGLFMQTEDVQINSCMNVGPRVHAVQSSLSGRCCYIHPPYVVNLQVSMREIHRAPGPACQYLLRITCWTGLPHVWWGHRWVGGILLCPACMGSVRYVDKCGHSYSTSHNGNRFRNRNFQDEISGSKLE